MAVLLGGTSGVSNFAPRASGQNLLYPSRETVVQPAHTEITQGF